MSFKAFEPQFVEIKTNFNTSPTNSPSNHAIRRAIKWGLPWLGLLWPGLALAGIPNGTWLSQSQIRFYSSNGTVGQVMRDIQGQKYRVVFLDFRRVSDEVQVQVSKEARRYKLIPVVWVQSPQYRSLSVAELIHEARHGDGIQIDDHFFAHYSIDEFQSLSSQYQKPIFCSIQPSQAALLSDLRCNQLDVQCYTSDKFNDCLKIADHLKAVVSLSENDTFRYREQLGVRRFNVFLWPYSSRSRETSFQERFWSRNPLGKRRESN